MNMKKNEKRSLSFSGVELRAENKEGKKCLTGILPYNSPSSPMFGYREIISPTAFRKSLADKANIFALVNHDDNRVLGSTGSGTLELESTEAGLICRVELPKTSYAKDLYETVSRGDVKTLSFAFYPVKWQDDAEKKTRTLKEIRPTEVSFGVTFPAYPETASIAHFRGIEKMGNVEKLNEILEKDALDESEKKTLQESIKFLQNLIGNESKEAAEAEPSTDTLADNSTSTNEAEKKNDGESEKVQFLIEAELAS